LSSSIKDYRFTKRVVTKVYSDPKSIKGRKIKAQLFVGEWAKKLEESGEELKVRYRGGEGYISKTEAGEKRALEIYFIDVGQGDAILIEMPNDRRILIDGGPDGRANGFLTWKYNLIKYAKRFDAVILTHGDADHAAGMTKILNNPNIQVERIYHNGIARRNGEGLKSFGKTETGMLVDLYSDIAELEDEYKNLSKGFKDWYKAVQSAKERAAKNGYGFTCQRADQYTEKLVLGGEDEIKITFLGPINQGSPNSPKLKLFENSDSKTMNGNSVAIIIEYGKARMLFCGDINPDAEALYIEKHGNSLEAHVFKANHHGSPDFTTNFLKTVSPWVSVVSSGSYNEYGHPRANLLGSLGRYSKDKVEKPLLFSTQIAAAFKEIPKNEFKLLMPPEKLKEKGYTDDQIKTLTEKFNKKTFGYEKVTHGMIHVRTNGQWLAAGRPFGGKSGCWDWEAYAFDLESGSLKRNDILL